MAYVHACTPVPSGTDFPAIVAPFPAMRTGSMTGCSRSASLTHACMHTPVSTHA